MRNEQLKVMQQPTTQGFLEFLAAHAGEDAPMGQWGYYPGARGEILTEEDAAKVAGAHKWIGMPVCDANGLVEAYAGKSLPGDFAARLKAHFDEWCYGHVGDQIQEMIQIPGGAVFRTDAAGNFTDVAYLYRKNGPGALDWDIFVCNDAEEGLRIGSMDDSWSHWGLTSMIMRFNVDGPMTENLPGPGPGVPYGVVWSSVLNFRDAGDRHLVTTIPNGTVVELTGVIDGGWTQCRIGDKLGYVFTRFLVKHNV